MGLKYKMGDPIDEEARQYLLERLPLDTVNRMVEAGSPSPSEEAGEVDPAESTGADPEGEEDGGEDLLGASEQYDPKDHKVVEVLKYLETASGEEKQRVIELESKGLQRSTILSA